MELMNGKLFFEIQITIWGLIFLLNSIFIKTHPVILKKSKMTFIALKALAMKLKMILKKR
jgi:hypothetical protein